MNLHLQSIERACQKANPKLLELSFWCEVKIEETKYRVIAKNGIISSKYWIVSENDWVSDRDAWEFKILWHPITLQDILLAMWPWYSITCWGLFFMAIPWDWYERFDKLKVTNIRYDLEKSPYYQSEEVLSFLAENIK